MKIEKIYFDMDGILADFDRGIWGLCHMDPLNQASKNKADDDAMWESLSF